MTTAVEDVPLPAPDLFTRLQPIKDDLKTDTSVKQREAAEECLPFHLGTAGNNTHLFGYSPKGVPRLRRDEHIYFLHDSLADYPASFVAYDPIRPWVLYWALMGLSLLGEDVTEYRARAVETFIPMQHPNGGFGGGQGQYAHVAGSYAAVLSLVLVGGEEAYSLINRQQLWRWLGQLKQPDGGFRVCLGGEEDVRGAYCAMTIISLLNLPLNLPEHIFSHERTLTRFDDGLEEWLGRCQTYEGGIAGAPGNEAHGAYAFCALACLGILKGPRQSLQCLHLPSLMSWLSSRQNAPEGGYCGRTNKLVDSCYSHWIGGCWPLVQTALGESEQPFEHYSKEGLARYILACCQAVDGGLRDKPAKGPDSYHSCYTLAGLSSMQHLHYHTADPGHENSPYDWRSRPLKTSDTEAGGLVHQDDLLLPVHPLFMVPHDCAHSVREWAQKQPEDWANAGMKL